MEQDDIAGLRQEIRRGNRWKAIHNKNNETAVQVAIRKGNTEALKILHEHGAFIALEDVHYFLHKFFTIDPAFFKTDNNDLLDNWFTINEQTIKNTAAILSAFNGATTDEQRNNIISIINFFVTHEDISLQLGLTSTNNDAKNFIIKNFKTIFFQENQPNNILLKTMVKNFQTADTAHALLSFLMALKKPESMTVLHLPAPPANTPCEYKQSEQVAAAIMDYSRELYQQISNNSPFRFIAYEIPHPSLLRLIDFSNRLSIFVERSITSRTNEKSRSKNYQFWKKVYDSLMIRGDFMSSFSIAVALGHSAVLKSIKGKAADSALITDPTNSFKAYRDATRLHNQGTYLPSMQIMLKDLASLKEVGIFADMGFKPNMVFILARHKKEMVQTLLFARRSKLLHDKNIAKAIDLLPDSDITTNTLLWRRIYQTIIKGQAFSP